MRFSIRDLLWLMAVVALAATVYAERAHMKRLIAKWQETSEKQAQESAAAERALRARVDGLREQNAILQHQLVVQLEKDRQREAEDTVRRQAAALLQRTRAPARTAPRIVSEELEN